MMRDGGVEHMLKLVLIFWRHVAEIGDKAKERDVENTVMGGAVIAHNPAPVDGEGDR